MLYDKIVIFRLIDKLLNDFISNDNQQQLVDNKLKLDPERTTNQN